jgi:hypothetical protein
VKHLTSCFCLNPDQRTVSRPLCPIATVRASLLRMHPMKLGLHKCQCPALHHQLLVQYGPPTVAVSRASICLHGQRLHCKTGTGFFTCSPGQFSHSPDAFSLRPSRAVVTAGLRTGWAAAFKAPTVWFRFTVSRKLNQNPKKKVYKPFKQFLNCNICYKKVKHKIRDSGKLF